MSKIKRTFKLTHFFTLFAPICAARPLSNFASSYSGKSYPLISFHPQTTPSTGIQSLYASYTSRSIKPKGVPSVETPYKVGASFWLQLESRATNITIQKTLHKWVNLNVRLELPTKRNIMSSFGWWPRWREIGGMERKNYRKIEKIRSKLA